MLVGEIEIAVDVELVFSETSIRPTAAVSTAQEMYASERRPVEDGIAKLPSGSRAFKYRQRDRADLCRRNVGKSRKPLKAAASPAAVRLVSVRPAGTTGNGQAVCQRSSVPFARSLVRTEKEKPVLDDRPAERAAELMSVRGSGVRSRAL